MLSAAADVIRSKTGRAQRIKGDDIPDAISEALGLPVMRNVRPAFLQSGDKVAIVALSSEGTSEMVTAGQTLFESWGLTVTLDYYHADPTADRGATATWLIGALEDTTVKAIITLRGGWGSALVVPHVPDEIIAANPKWIVGYSDVSGFLCEFLHAGVQSVHGPMCASIVNHPDDDGSLDKLHDILFGVSGYNSLTFSDGNSENVIGQATGRLVGGNTSTIRPYFYGKHSAFGYRDDLIVFLEETGTTYAHEYYNRLMMLKSACGDRIRGLLIGDLPLTANSGITGTKYSITKEIFPNVPIAFTSKVGHGDINYPVVVGSVASLNVTTTSDSTITFCQETVDVTTNIVKASLETTQHTVAIGGGYKARVVPDPACSISLISVMMAGTDVTSTAWNAATRTISIANVTGDIIITATAADAVPSGYTAVGYLTCNGTQWVNVGFKPSSTLPFDVTVAPVDSALEYHSAFGARTSASSLRYELTLGYLSGYNVPCGAVLFGYGSGSTNRSKSRPLGKVRVVMSGGVADVYDNGGHLFRITRTGTFTASYNMAIGAVNNKGTAANGFKGKLYRMTFGTTSDLIPVKRDSDGVAGMYDIVRDTFYPSGTGTDFGYGND